MDIHIPVLEKMYHKRLRAYKKIGYEIGNLGADAQITAERIFDAESYLPTLAADLGNARKEIMISSPGLGKGGMSWFVEAVASAQTAGAKVAVLTLATENYPEEAREQNKHYQDLLGRNGIHVAAYPTLCAHFAIIDRRIVWYGNMNLLSTPKVEDNMLRLEDGTLAEELLQSVAKMQGS